MNTYAVPDYKFDMIPVHHAHQSVFKIIVCTYRGALAENSLTIHSTCSHFRLEDMVFIFGLYL